MCFMGEEGWVFLFLSRSCLVFLEFSCGSGITTSKVYTSLYRAEILHSICWTDQEPQTRRFPGRLARGPRWVSSLSKVHSDSTSFKFWRLPDFFFFPQIVLGSEPLPLLEAISAIQPFTYLKKSSQTKEIIRWVKGKTNQKNPGMNTLPSNITPEWLFWSFVFCSVLFELGVEVCVWGGGSFSLSLVLCQKWYTMAN